MIGNIKLLRIMRSFLIRVAAHGGSGRTGNLRNPHRKRFLSNFFRLSCGNNHAGIRHGDTNAGNNLRKDFIINSVIKLSRIDVIRLLQSRHGNGMRSHTVHCLQVLRVHEKSCKFIAIFVEAEEHADSHIVDSAFHGSVHRFRVITIVMLRSGRVKLLIGFLVVGLLEENIGSNSRILQLSIVFYRGCGNIDIDSANVSVLMVDAVNGLDTL